MAIEQRFTDLPTVSSSQLTDIICAVQGYVASPLNLGVSTQQTLSQVLALVQSNLILSNSGNPNGSLAGTIYQLCWDTVDNILWVCTTSGTSSTAVWTRSIPDVDNNFVVVTGTSQSMSISTTYQPNNVGLVTLSLPSTSPIGSRINVVGFGAGGWKISQASGQQIIVGNVSSTLGASGYIASSNRYDSIQLSCVVADTTWQALSGPQGIITVI